MKIFTYSVSTRAMRALVLGLMLSTVFSVFGQTIPAPYTAPGTFTWPCNFNGVVKVECWGGGGAGGGGTAYTNTGANYRIGGGGGGGSYAVRTITVVSGTTYNITVGGGGVISVNGTITATFGGAGGFSSFSGGAVAETKASGGTGGGGASNSQNFGVGGVLGGVYGYTVSAQSGASGVYAQNATVAAPPMPGTAATVRVGISGNNPSAGITSISFLIPQTMGSGYTTTNPGITVGTGGTGAGQTFSALANPNVDVSGPDGAIGTPGGTGSQATAAASTSAAFSVTAAVYNSGTDRTTLTISATNANITTSSLIYGAALGLTTGSAVFSVATTTVVINGNIAPPNTTYPKTVYYHNSNVTSGAGGGAGGPGGGPGGASVTNNINIPNNSAPLGLGGTAPGGGGSGGISNVANARSGGAGADGQVKITLISLGIELAQFDAKAQQKSTLLSWTTASEKDNAHFSIEQSTNGKDFKTVGKVTGNGTTSSATAYNFEHSTPSVGVNYYRLKQTDFDGKTSFSPVKSVVFGNDKFALKTTLVQNQLTVVANGDEVANLAIFNSAGQQVLNAKVQGEQMIDVSNLPSGMYIVRMANETARFVKQ